MKHRTVLSAALSASALLLLSAPAWATTHTNLFENFSNFNAGWGATGDGSKLLNGATEETAIAGTDVSGWTGTGLVFQSPSSIRLGNSTGKGIVLSPVIRLSDTAITAGAATLSFHAARTASGVGVTTSPKVTVLNPDGTAVDGISVYSPGRLGDCSSLVNIDSCYTNTSGVAIQHDYTGLPNEFRLRFESSASSDGRVAIDAVLVVQDIRDTLPAPATLALSGTAGANDFAVTWSSVANAEGYSVKLLDENDSVVSSNDVAVATTSASFTGLISSSKYTVVVVALGNYMTTDDSAPKTLDVETAASAVAAPTLVVANTSWTAGVAGTSAVSATLAGGESCAFASVEMSDGSSATVDNGILSWTPPASTTASSVTATFHVTYGSNGWDIDQVLSVAATPAPGAPSLTLSNATAQSFDASWAATAGGPVVEYKIRAWTGRATPDDATGGANENFAKYNDGDRAEGWIFKNTRGYANASAPVGFSNNNDWLASPNYGEATITNISFDAVQQGSVSGSHFYVYGTAGSTNKTDWILLGEATDAETGKLTSGMKQFDIPPLPRISRVMFQYEKSSGNVSFGSFSVSGTDWPAANFLEGWGGAKVSVNTATSQTFSNPVPGTANYVEVTAVGLAGLSTSTIESIAVPAAPRKPVLISIQ